MQHLASSQQDDENDKVSQSFCMKKGQLKKLSIILWYFCIYVCRSGQRKIGISLNKRTEIVQKKIFILQKSKI